MQAARKHHLHVAAAVLAAAILGVSAPAMAPTAARAVTIEQKKAQQQAALAEMDALQAQFAEQADRYATTVQQIEETRREVSLAASETASLGERLTLAQEALNGRAVQMYQDGEFSTIELVFATQSLADFINWTDALLLITKRDAELAVEVKGLRQESVGEERRLDSRMSQLAELQRSAEEQQLAIQVAITRQQVLIRSLSRQIQAMIEARARQFRGGAPNKGFNPEYVISDAAAGASGSMSAADIQSFLKGQPGSLKNYVGPDWTEKRRISAAQIIAEAAVAGGVSPKVLIATLQKEQSLITEPNPTQRAMDWATGCGCPDSGARYEQFKGFGKQVWFAAQKLGKDYRSRGWVQGMTMSIDGKSIKPANYPTFAQYTYTPHFPGVRSFWMLYWRFFGDPLQ